MNEYGSNKTLTEILEELTVYCKLNSGINPVKIRLELPKAVLDHYNRQFEPREKGKEFGEIYLPGTLHSLILSAGTVELKVYE